MISDVGNCASQPTLGTPKAADFLFVISCSVAVERVAQRWTLGKSGTGNPHASGTVPYRYSDPRLSFIVKGSSSNAEVKLTTTSNSSKNIRS